MNQIITDKTGHPAAVARVLRALERRSERTGEGRPMTIEPGRSLRHHPDTA